MAETRSKVEQEDEAPERDNNRHGKFIETLSTNGAAAVVVLDYASVSHVFLAPLLVAVVVAVVSTCHEHDGRPIPRFLHVSSVQGHRKKEIKGFSQRERE